MKKMNCVNAKEEEEKWEARGFIYYRSVQGKRCNRQKRSCCSRNQATALARWSSLRKELVVMHNKVLDNKRHVTACEPEG